MPASAPLSFGWQSWSVIENYSTWHNIPIGTQENGFGGFNTSLLINNGPVVNNIQRIANMGKKDYSNMEVVAVIPEVCS